MNFKLALTWKSNCNPSASQTKNELQKQKTFQYATNNTFASKQHQVVLANIELEENHQNLNQLQIDLQDQLIKANENLESLSSELSKQYLIASTNGTVNLIYNARQ